MKSRQNRGICLGEGGGGEEQKKKQVEWKLLRRAWGRQQARPHPGRRGFQPFAISDSIFRFRDRGNTLSVSEEEKKKVESDLDLS